MTGSPRLRLGVVIDGAGSHPAAWRLDDDPASLFTLGRLAGLVGRAERSGFDLAVVPDAFGLQAGGEGARRGRLDAVLALAAVAPLTSSIGLVAATDVTHTEPFHLSKNIATLDLVSGGRAAWWPHVSTTTEVAELFGRKKAASPSELWAEASDAIEVVRRLWDSWEDDAVIRDAPTGRYLDRDKVHHIDFEGPFFRVRGPSITPRSPQGQPLVVVSADDEAAMATVADHADIAVVTARTAALVAQKRLDIRRLVDVAGRDPDDVTVMVTVDTLLADDASAATGLERELHGFAADAVAPGPLVYVGDPAGFAELLAAWATSGAVDGVLVRPIALTPTLGHLAGGVLPRLVAGGFVDAPGAAGPLRSLRDRFGLPRPVNRYATPAELVVEGSS